MIRILGTLVLTILALTALFAVLAFTVASAQDPATEQNSPTQTQPATPAQANPAQTAPAPAGAHEPQARLAPGSVIPVQLTKTVDAKKAKVGDEVVTKVTQDLQNTAGAILVPKDTKIIGHVMDAQRREKDQKESQLAIAFNQATISGQNVEMPMTIQAIIAPPNQNSSQDNAADQSGSGTSGGGMPSSGSQSAGMPGRSNSPQTAGNNEPLPQGSPSGGGNQAGSQPRPQITGATTGVVGISNLSLSPNTSGQQGSVMTSEKNNVKLEGGTFLLLRVSQ